jgi:hypothetical protein
MSEVPNAYPFDAEIYARRYASDGTALGGEFRVNSTTALDQGYPSVAALPGGYVIVWHSQGQDGDGCGVYGQRYAASGAAIGGEFQVNTTTAEPQSVATVAALPDGGFVVAWSSGYYDVGDEYEYQRDLDGQRFAADGSPVGGEFRINSHDAGDQEFVTIVTLADGGTLFAWNSNDSATGESLIQGQRFSADGSKFNELTVTGTAGNDTLRGGDGTQILIGGAGDDTYEADLAHDRIVEAAGGGHDTLWSRRSVVLPDVIEDLRLLGDADLDGTGNASANRIVGNDGGNRLAGLGGDDRLQGGGGDDRLDGGAGIDFALFAGPANGFTVAKQGSGWEIVDKSDTEGTDALLSIEKLQFADKAFDLVNPPRTSVPAYNTNNGFLFDAVFYLLDNPELVPAENVTTALAHYFASGAAQGKSPSSWFDATWYENRWPDLTPYQFDDATLFMHYNLYGVWEGRSAGPAFDQFDGNRYLADSPDVAAYVDAHLPDFLGSRSNGAIAHYVIYGQHELRPAFDLVGQPIDLGYTIDLAG